MKENTENIAKDEIEYSGLSKSKQVNDSISDISKVSSKNLKLPDIKQISNFMNFQKSILIGRKSGNPFFEAKSKGLLSNPAVNNHNKDTNSLLQNHI